MASKKAASAALAPLLGLSVYTGLWVDVEGLGWLLIGSRASCCGCSDTSSGRLDDIIYGLNHETRMKTNFFGVLVSRPFRIRG